MQPNPPSSRDEAWTRTRWVWVVVTLLVVAIVAVAARRNAPPAPPVQLPLPPPHAAESESATDSPPEPTKPIRMGPRLIGELRPLAGKRIDYIASKRGDALADTAWIGRRLIAAVRGSHETLLLEWSDLGAEPREIARLSGAAFEIDLSPTNATLVTRALPMWDTDDGTAKEVMDRTMTGRFVDVATGAVRPIEREPGSIRGAWAPDGQRIALSEWDEPEKNRITYVLSVATGKRVAETPAALNLDVERWDAQGLVLQRAKECFRWDPAPGRSPEKSPCPVERVSPDGDFRLESADNGTTIIAKDGTSRTYEHDTIALRFDDRWLGPRRILGNAGSMWGALSLDTLELRALNDEPDLRYRSHSTDGTLALFERDDGYFWAEVEPAPLPKRKSARSNPRPAST